jgi:hypothetical protein
MFQIGELFFSITPSRLCPQCNILDGRKDVSDCKQRWHYMGENHPALEQARQLDRRIDDAFVTEEKSTDAMTVFMG